MTYIHPERMSEHGAATARVAQALRSQILDGTVSGGQPLREVALAASHGVGRYTLRAALRLLETEGLVTITPNSGARVAMLDGAAMHDLYELRTILEVGAVRLALEHHDGRLPPAVRQEAERFARTCRSASSAWSDIVDGHTEVHAALVSACGFPRIIHAHAATAGELRLFIVQSRISLPPDWLAASHLQLVDDIESRGAEALEEHLREGAARIGVTADASPSDSPPVVAGHL
jgi:DNA-binding GntR family transcriptional regulator